MTPPLETLPDARGYFGSCGGMFMPETLMTALAELTAEDASAKEDPSFREELNHLLRDFAARLTNQLGGAKIYPKREDLLQPGAYKIHDALGQILARAPDGKKADHRRDRHRSARRCDGHRGRTFRPRMRDLHGRNRSGTPGAECRADALSRCAGRRRDRGPGQAKGSDQRAMRDWLTNRVLHDSGRGDKDVPQIASMGA